jgi:HAE1 family hydrophobic/amphiphilic exporter-1
MAKVIIGGQGLSLLLTLLVTPVAYSLWDDFSRYWSRFWSWVGRLRPRKAPHETAFPSQNGEELAGVGAVASTGPQEH